VNTVELVEYIFEGNARFCGSVLCGLQTSPRFEQFVEAHRDKIRKKIRDASSDHDAVKPVLAELWVAYLLLQVDRFSTVEYEIHGTNKRNPDLTVTHSESGLVFNVEVKRIGRTCVEIRFETWLRRVKGRIRTIPSRLALSMDIGDFNTRIDLLDRLEAQFEDIVRYITTTIVASDKEMPLGSKKDFSVPGFEKVFKFRLRKPSRKPTSDYTSYDWGMFPDFATHNEYKKFGDEICDPEHLGQMLPDMVNILAITTDSSMHDELDLERALTSLGERAAKGEDQFFIGKRFTGAADFITQLERLSGIVLAGAFFPVRSGPKVLWCNSRAKRLVPADIRNLLQAMVCQNPLVSFESFMHDADRLPANSSGSAKA